MSKLSPPAPDSASTLLAAANGCLREGRPLDALQNADRALALDGASAEGWFVLALALRAIGDRGHAIAALTRATSFDPGLAAAHARLGCLHDEANQPLRAEAAFLRATRLNPGDAASHVNLSSLYGRADQFALAAEHARRALAVDPSSFGAHQNLASLHAKQGRDADAQRHRDLAYRGRNLLRVGPPNPRRRVLTLASAAWGNTPDRYLLPVDRYERLIWFVEYATEAQMAALPPHDAIFNAIGDPDSTGPTAAKVAEFLPRASRAVLNPPDKIARTARHLARDLFTGIEGLEVPATIRLAAGSAKPRGLAGPLIVRPIGSHGGEGLKLTANADEAQGAAAGRECYLTAFRDFRSADGLYRKYRMFFVDRRPYPYHLAIAGGWLVHYATSGTADHPERLAEERRFLEDPERALGARAMDAIRAVGERLDLDFAGVDFSLLPDGRVLLFEANATMLVHPEATGGPLAHKNAHVDAITRAFWERLER